MGALGSSRIRGVVAGRIRPGIQTGYLRMVHDRLGVRGIWWLSALQVNRGAADRVPTVGRTKGGGRTNVGLVISAEEGSD